MTGLHLTLSFLFIFVQSFFFKIVFPKGTIFVCENGRNTTITRPYVPLMMKNNVTMFAPQST